MYCFNFIDAFKSKDNSVNFEQGIIIVTAYIVKIFNPTSSLSGLYSQLILIIRERVYSIH